MTVDEEKSRADEVESARRAVGSCERGRPVGGRSGERRVVPKKEKTEIQPLEASPFGATSTLLIYEFERTLRAEEAMARLSMEEGRAGGEGGGKDGCRVGRSRRTKSQRQGTQVARATSTSTKAQFTSLTELRYR